MAGQKRILEESSIPKAKKKKLTDSAKDKSRHEQLLQSTSNLVSGEVEFPRGGGSTFTPAEVKAIRAEAVKEADAELFADSKIQHMRKKRKPNVSLNRKAKPGEKHEKSDKVRIEHLNYKRLTVGMKIFGQIISIQSLALIISLPNQLFGHIPLTQLSSQFTGILDTLDDEDDSQHPHTEPEDSTQGRRQRVPDLSEMFSVGQYVRGIVTDIHATSSTELGGIGRSRDEIVKSSRRVELSLIPGKVNAGVQIADLINGFVLSAAVRSSEDHGYLLDIGLSGVSGFLSFKHTPRDKTTELHVGQVLDVCVIKMSSNGKTCTVTTDADLIASSFLSEVTTVTSILPGASVQALVTAVSSAGLNLQVLGYFEGTVDHSHLPDKEYHVGQTVKCRVLYDISAISPPRFALALTEHVMKLQVKFVKAEGNSESTLDILEAFPVGMMLEAVKVIEMEHEQGLIVEVRPDVRGFIHISHVSDDHVPSLSSSSGPWKLGSYHSARVIGHYHFDGSLQLSLRRSVLEQKFLRVSDVRVGEVVVGTVKRLTDQGLFVSISGNVDGVVWPNHYADITLKHPSRRFKTGDKIKCRILVVDEERKRIFLTAKKTLVESQLPIISSFDDAKIGLVTYAVVFKVTDKVLLVEFYNNQKGIVPLREASEALVGALSDAFSPGKVVKVRITSIKPEEGRIVASIRQAASNLQSDITDISGVEIGDTVAGNIIQIHKENAVLTLHPSQARGLISLNNLANDRNTSVAQLRASLKASDKLDELIVVSRNPEKGFVIVARKPRSKNPMVSKTSLMMDTVTVGQVVGGRVTRHTRNGAHLKLTARISGSLHPTDVCDDYETGLPFPGVDSILKAIVIAVDEVKKHLILSTRPSRLHPAQTKPVADREISTIGDLKVGDAVRGFIKSVTEHGLFVSIGRDIDARVQIKELFDEYIKEWKGKFKANQLVKGRILSLDTENKKVEMTFRSGDLTRTSSGLTLSDLHEGQKVDGRVKRVESFGLFIEIDGSKLSGLCHKSQLSDNKDADVTFALRSFSNGDKVKAIILSINMEKRQMSLGLKPSYFTEDDETNEAAVSNKEEDHSFGIVDDGHGDDLHEDEDEAEEEEKWNDSEEEAMDVDIMDFDQVTTQHTRPSSSTVLPVPSLKLKGGFQWSEATHATGEDDVDPAYSSDESSEEDLSGKRKKRKRKEIENDLTADMHTKTPESNADFERLLLSSPNSSYLWVQYMSFQLQLSEVDKARQVGRRALETINFREEQEKLNVWIALLNLENIYGSDETLETTFKDAARHNDSKTIHLRLAAIFDQTEKYTRAEEQYKRTCKKFGQSSKVWTLLGEYYLRRGELEEARKLLPRSLQSLDKRKHLKTISKFAQLEYKFGDVERGKTIFEGIVDSHSKRWDLWSIYMDMEAGQNDIQSLRNLFDRVLALKMTSHKAKSFFKKWLALERRLGDEDGATEVKEKAIAWTQNAVNS